MANSQKFGRKWTHVIFFLLCAVFGFLFLLLPGIVAIVSTICLFNLFGMAGYGVQYTLTPESFPTKLRSRGNGLCSVCNRLTGLIYPLIYGYILDQTDKDITAPVLISVVSLLIATVFSMFIKETRSVLTEEEEKLPNEKEQRVKKLN